MTHPRPHLDRIVKAALADSPARVAIAYPCSSASIQGAVAAHKLKLIEPILVGPGRRISSLIGEQASDFEIVDTGEDPIAAAQACVTLCHTRRADVIMKGSLHTEELMRVVISKESGLRTARRVSHTFVFDIPIYAKPLLMADCVVNINPGLMDKRDITQNTIDLAHALGIACPYVGILSATETVNPAIPGTVDAAALSKMADRGQITGAVVDGPLPFDIAISTEAARIKGIESPISEQPDALIVPNLEAGNLLYKQLVYLAGADCAGVVLGTSVPIVLTSRADSPKARIASCALAIIYARHAHSKLARMQVVAEQWGIEQRASVHCLT